MRIQKIVLFLTFFIAIFFTKTVFADTIIDGDITENTTWTVAESPYIVSLPVYVSANTTLSVEPGVIVKFEQMGELIVYGTLEAQGTTNEPIYFTSNADDSLGGDTNGDGNQSIPEAGDWNGIFSEGSISVLDFKNINISYSLYSILVEACARVSVDTLFVKDSIVGVYLQRCPNISLSHIKLKNLQNGLIADGRLTATVDDLNVDTVSGPAVVIEPPFTNFSLSNFHLQNGIEQGLVVSSNSNITLTDGIIENFASDGFLCIGFDRFHPTANISNVSINNNDGGISSTECNLSITGSTIKNNSSYGLYNDNPAYIIDAKNNFWGDSSGPYNSDSNPDGLGNEVSDNVLFDPWCTTETCVVAPTRNPVIIIPGIMGTYLYKDYDDHAEIWPNINKLLLTPFDEYLNDLLPLSSGEEDSSKHMVFGDVIRSIHNSSVFSGLISNLTTNGYTEGADLFVLPYDWRFSNTKNAELLKNKITAILASTGTDKVDIVAHSMGGLLAKEYIQENGKDKVNHLIFLGTPHLGAPKAFKTLVYGDDLNISLFGLLGLNEQRAKIISQNMPSIYELLPTRTYGLRYISKDSEYLDFDTTKKLLDDKDTNQALDTNADIFHQSIDTIDLSGIKVANISACGEPTLSAINIRSARTFGPFTFKEDYKLSYANGDSTVPLDSSSGISNITQYFVNKVSHMELPSAGGVPDAVLDILKDMDIPSGGAVFTGASNCSPINGQIISVHSPITLDIYNTAGDHSGLDANGNIESNIAGVVYDTIGDAKFAFIPDGLDVQVKGSATGSGTFDLAVEKVTNGATTETKFWNDIPITAQSTMSLDTGSYDTISKINLDTNGDGTVDKNISNSNTLPASSDYLDVPAVVQSATISRVNTSHGGGGQGVTIVQPLKKIVPVLTALPIQQVVIPVINTVATAKNTKTKKVVVGKKNKIVPSQAKVLLGNSTVIDLSASVINSGQGSGFWSTIKLLFNRIFH